MTLTRTRVTALAVALAVPAAGLATFSSADAASTATVHIKNIDFTPKKLKVKRGTTVTWKFEDGDSDTPHNVTSTGKNRFKSSGSKQNGTYSVRFTKKGTYTYVCTIHANMKASIVVS